jgi:hypothetical protein
MKSSRYIKYDRRQLPCRKKAIPRNWADTQDGKFYRCWNCGFTCNTDRDKLGSGDGYVTTDAILATDLVLFSGNLKANTLSVSMTTDLSLVEVDSNGDAKIFKRNFCTTITAGCPFCGCKAYK